MYVVSALMAAVANSIANVWPRYPKLSSSKPLMFFLFSRIQILIENISLTTGMDITSPIFFN
jgi:hypothetical protein